VEALSRLRNKARKFFAIFLLCLIFLLSVDVNEPFEMTLHARHMLNQFDVLTENDIDLQLWMKQNLDDSSVILVSWGDAGQYVPVISEKKVIFEYVNNLDICPLTREHAEKYRNLLKILEISPDNPVALELLEYLNITHIYVGAKEATRFGSASTLKINFPEYTVLNASLLNSAGHYKLVRRVGNAWLFEVVYNATVTTMISKCDAITYWFTSKSDINASTTILVDTTTYMEGQGAIKWAFKFNGSSRYVELFFDPPGTWNFTNKEFIEFWVYGTNTKAAYAFHVVDSLNRVRYIEFTDNFNGWKRFILPISAGAVRGDPNFDWGSVDWLSFQIFAATILPAAADNVWRYLYIDNIWVKG